MPVNWLDRACIVVPALDAAASLGRVVDELRREIPERNDAIIVVDDGSRDETGRVARDLGCIVVAHPENRGKGAALRSGLSAARDRGWEIALTVDADGQHPADEARRVLLASEDPTALVLGVRDLSRDGAPRKNRVSNGISNFFLSRFAGRPLRDTQCGLRRYPIDRTLALGARGAGYDFEAELLLRAVWAGVPIVEEPVRVRYPDDRVTHFHSVRDPWRIIRTVVAALAEAVRSRTVLRIPRRARAALGVVAALVAAPLVAHLTVERTVRFDPPAIATPRLTMEERDGVRRAGRGWAAVRGGLRVVSLAGAPEELGAEHTALLFDRMAADEAVLWNGFTHVVPFGPARALMFDLARLRYRHVEDGFPDARRRELGAEARGFDPDPYSAHMPTYPRMVFLHALYDIALGFEHSPLLGGCTAFGLGPTQTEDGHALFARAFDFEAADVFDRDKVVFVVREDGRVPFASVAWPGLVGVVTGMNAEGVALAVQGGRAREPSATGIPVAFSLREALSRARDTSEAVDILAKQEVMVSHMVFVGDAKGRYAIVERAPGAAAFVREGNAVTNHFEGPLAGDPRDAEVRRTTTTLARRARIDQLLRDLPPRSGSVARAIAILRDHECQGDTSCPVGDRRAIDAFIATHGVVADLTGRALWVSVGPHLSGRFVKIDLGALVSRDSRDDAALPPVEPETMPEDPALRDGRYAEGRARAGGPLLGGSP